MTTSTNVLLSAANLPHLTWDQLGVALDIVDRRIRESKTILGANRADALSARIMAEIERRGCVARAASDGRMMVGPPSLFVPIGA